VTIAAIVAAVTFLSAACIGAAAALLPYALPVQAWVVACALLDAVALYGIFERRSGVWGRIVSRGRPRSPAVALTFDDGPVEPYTSEVLDVLRMFEARATFFVLGARVTAAPAAVRRAAQEGHEIGNHTWDHPALPLKGPGFIRSTIRRTSNVVEQVTGLRPRVFRAPFGWRNPWLHRSARQEGCEPVAWTVGVHDTDRPGVEEIERRAIEGLNDGVILLLHDGRSFDPSPDASEVVAALPGILREVRRRDMRFLTVSELLAETRGDG
jgi:peptidoglycan/xylan/chitin deacetylase (PgdA/CDA1 family)